MQRCETCGNEYDKAFQVTVAGQSHTFDSAEMPTLTQQALTWLNNNGARHVFMENLGDYLYARTKSLLGRCGADDGGV